MGVRNTWMEVEWGVDERPGKGDVNGRDMIKGERLMERNSAADVDELGKVAFRTVVVKDPLKLDRRWSGLLSVLS